jgi:Big-like domain-containing protein
MIGRRRLVAAVAVTLWLSLPVALPAQTAPAGFIETAGSVDVRPRLTAGQIQALLPARGTFTFPAPYNTTAIRLTNPDDCGGADCVDAVGYSYWRNINNHAGQSTMLIFLTLDRNRGGGGATLFRYDKASGEVTKVGSLFEPTSPFSWATGEGWYFSATQPTTLYVNFPVTSTLLRYDVLAHTFSTVFDVASRPDLFGTNRYIWQFHSSDDDRVHSATLADAGSYLPLGCLAYREDTQEFFYFPTKGFGYDECQVDKSGRWLLIKEKLSGDLLTDVDNRIIDLTTGVETDLRDRDGAGGHSDNGFGYMVAADNWNPLPNAYRLWRFDQSPLQGTVVYADSSWSAPSLQHLSHANATALPPEQQYVCGSGASSIEAPRANEVICVPLDGSLRVLVVAPVMTDLSAAGGGADPYRKLPKGNLDVTGQYFIWTSNMAGDRLDAFIAQVPAGLLASRLGVTLTSPVNGATVFGGTVSVSASAPSGAEVAAVQFTLDDAALGAEVNALPASALWDTRTVTDGPHVLAAIARDAAGNIARASVKVTVKNAVRVEESDPAAHFSPCAWDPGTLPLASGGRAIRSNAAGAQAVFDFTGTGVSWIGLRDAWSGIANVYVDGLFNTTVDAFSLLAQPQAVLFAVGGLVAGPHRLVVESTGTQQPLAQGSGIWVDAFDVVAADSTVTRAEENAANVHAGPCAWYPSAGAGYSGGGAMLSAQPGAEVDFDFTGSGVSWIAPRDAWSGIAAVQIDGVPQTEVDLYAASSQTQATVYSIGGLPPGGHRLSIQVTGRQNPASGGPWVWIDAFDVSP